RHQGSAPQPLEQTPVGTAAAEEDVLAVVHQEPVALERVGRAAQPGPDLDQRRALAGPRAVEGRRDPREPPSDHEDAALAQAAAPRRLRAATQAFFRIGSETR